jgi:uncharacterized protein (DUF885 family)
MRTNAMSRWLLLSVWVVTLPALAQERRPQPDIGTFFDSFTAEWVRHDPDLATATRYFSGAEQDRLEQQLTPNTRAWDLERVALARRGLSELAKYDASKLSESDRLSAQLMHWMLDSTVRGEKYSDYRFPLEQFGGANVDLVETLTLRHPLATGKDASNYVKRLGQVATRMDEAVVEGKRIAAEGFIPPAFILKTTLASMRTFREVPPEQNALVTVLVQKMGAVEAMAPDERTKLQAEATRLVGTEVYPAWDRAIKLLESLQSKATEDAGLWRFKGGADAYSFFLSRFTTTDYTPEQIHQIGLKQVASIEGQMDAILKKLGRTDGPVRERIEKLRNDLRYPDPQSEAARAAIMKDTNGFIEDALKRSQTLFDLQPQTKVIAQPFPRFREQSAAANYNRAPLDGSRPAIFQIPLRDARMTKFGLRSLVYHETVPGHHFQIALEQENTSLPRFRQARVLGGISALSEGWALYAEKLVAENGWYDGDPEGLLGMLDAQLFRARRLVVDTGLHAKHWTRQQAIDYGLEPSEVERYVVNPGQACAYMIGQLKLLELRDKARDTLGAKFKPQEFHDVVLKTGTAPLDMVAVEVDRYIRATSGKNP